MNQPVQVRFPAGVKIAFIPTDVMPYDTALAVDTQGHVWGWGPNGGAELCLGNTTTYTTPVRLPSSHVTTLAGASNHALYDSSGTVYACGQNIDGDLGTGSMNGTTTPMEVRGLDWVVGHRPGGVVRQLRGPAVQRGHTSTGATTPTASSATGWPRAVRRPGPGGAGAPGGSGRAGRFHLE